MEIQQSKKHAVPDDVKRGIGLPHGEGSSGVKFEYRLLYAVEGLTKPFIWKNRFLNTPWKRSFE